MTPNQIEQAKRQAEYARRRLDTTLGALQQRLHPKTLATGAWDGVREKSNDIADGAIEAVRQRPGTVSLALAAFTLFVARHPIRRAVGRFFTSEEEQGRIVTEIDTPDNDYNVTAPLVRASAREGVQ